MSGAVRMEQEGAGGHHQERDREPEGHGLGTQQDQPGAHQAGGFSCGSRSRRTSSVMTPIAISGWLSTASWNASRRSRNASTWLERRHRRRARLRVEDRELADDAAGVRA